MTIVRQLASAGMLGLLASTSAYAIDTTVPAEPPVKSEVLVQRDQAWNGTSYSAYPTARPQLTVLRMTIPAHSALPWHTHAAPNAGYVLSGHLTLEDHVSGRKKTFHEGEAFTEQVGPVHRGFTDDVPCQVVLTYAGTPGMPLSVPEPGQEPDCCGHE